MMRKGHAQKMLNEYFDRECEFRHLVNVNKYNSEYEIHQRM